MMCLLLPHSAHPCQALLLLRDAPSLSLREGGSHIVMERSFNLAILAVLELVMVFVSAYPTLSPAPLLAPALLARALSACIPPPNSKHSFSTSRRSASASTV
jgi:hypothetical protein